MGFVDSLNAEDRVQVRFSDFYNLVKYSAKYEVVLNAVKCNVPNKFIYEMLTGATNKLQEEKEELESKLVDLQEYLEKYMNTGLTPSEITELLEKQRMYEEEKFRSIVNESAFHDPDAEQQEPAKRATQVEESPASAPSPEPTESTPYAATATGGDSEKEKKKVTIDIGKIMALKKAGWKIKDIADEMHMEPSAVSNAIWRYKKAMEEKN